MKLIHNTGHEPIKQKSYLRVYVELCVWWVWQGHLTEPFGDAAPHVCPLRPPMGSPGQEGHDYLPAPPYHIISHPVIPICALYIGIGERELIILV